MSRYGLALMLLLELQTRNRIREEIQELLQEIKIEIPYMAPDSHTNPKSAAKKDFVPRNRKLFLEKNIDSRGPPVIHALIGQKRFFLGFF